MMGISGEGVVCLLFDIQMLGPGGCSRFWREGHGWVQAARAEVKVSEMSRLLNHARRESAHRLAEEGGMVWG